jgi:hypothetical protein
MRLTSSGLLAMVALGCSADPVLVSPDQVAVALTFSEFDQSRQEWRSAIRVTNHGAVSITLGACGSVIVQREDPAGWEFASGPGCTFVPTVPRQPLQLAAGATTTFTISKPIVPPSGATYRARVLYATTGTAVASETVSEPVAVAGP